MSNVVCLKTFRDERRIRAVGSQVATAIEMQPSQGWTFESIQESIRARFADSLPEHVELAWRSSWTEPYAFGDVANCAWRTRRPKIWNRPYPFAMRVQPDSNLIGRGVRHGGNDPLAWMDMKYRVAFNHIAHRQLTDLEIHTRSDLVAHDEYIAVLGRRHRIYIHVLTDDEQIGRVMEPGAPSYSRRITAFEKLKSLGFDVTLVHDRFTDPVIAARFSPLKRPVGEINPIKLTTAAKRDIQRATGMGFGKM